MNSLISQANGSNSALVTFLCYTLAVFSLAIISSRLQRGRSFLSEYFLGSRNLGMWAFALTLAATSASGGSFTGFPSLVYSHGWVLALWIGSYMLVPALMMGLLGKRLNQMARQANAITIPDVLHSRFDSRTLGTLATLLIIFFLTCNLVAQFKSGAVMLSTLLDDNPLFQIASSHTGRVLDGVPLVTNVNAAYLLCLVFFAFAVIVYTSYGGFRAVVWTDVMQGIVMVFGVLILLPMTLYHVGGLANATRDLAKMVPPEKCNVILAATSEPVSIAFGDWVEVPATGQAQRRVFRTSKQLEILVGSERSARMTPAIEIRSPHEVARIQARQDVRVDEVLNSEAYAYGSDEPGVYVTAPGPSASESSGFLPLGVAISFFFFWTFSGAGQPSNMVRLMSFNSSLTLKRAIITVSIYFSLIYFPLVVIFCCARVLLPGMEVESDRIMPALAEHVTRLSGTPWLAGLLVAAPFAAVMSTVDSFLLMISSAIVRDVYQRDINPHASEKTMKRLTYAVTACVGIAAFLGALNPPEYLQHIIVFTGGGLSACFLVPVALALYWPRFNAPGAIAGMLGGFVTHSLMYVAGWLTLGGFRPVKLAGFDPFIPELIVSLLACVVVCRATRAPSDRLVNRFFMADDSPNVG